MCSLFLTTTFRIYSAVKLLETAPALPARNRDSIIDVLTVGIGLSQLDAVVNRPHAMPDLEPAIPQGMQHGTHERFDVRLPGLGTEEKHEIDIRMGGQFTAAISSQGHQTALVRAG